METSPTGTPEHRTPFPRSGGAMDLAIGAKRVFVMMTLFGKDGTAKLVPECSYPLTGLRCVSRLYTEYAIFDIDNAGDGRVRVLETFAISIAALEKRLHIALSCDPGASVAEKVTPCSLSDEIPRGVDR